MENKIRSIHKNSYRENAVIHHLLAEGRPTSGGKEIYSPCPRCRGNFYWNIAKDRGFCHSKKCNLKVYGIDHLKRVLQEEGKPALLRLNKDYAPVGGGEEEVPELYSAIDVAPALNYMLRRKISRDTIKKLGNNALYNMKNNALYFPIDKLGGGEEEYYWRYLNKKSKIRWRGRTGLQKQNYVYGLRHLREDIGVVILVEGIFDLLCPGFLGQGLAMLGASASDELIAWLVNREMKVILCTDLDEGGRIANSEIRLRMRDAGIPCRSFPPLDNVEFYLESGKDPGDFCKSSLYSKRARKERRCFENSYFR